MKIIPKKDNQALSADPQTAWPCEFNVLKALNTTNLPVSLGLMFKESKHEI